MRYDAQRGPDAGEWRQAEEGERLEAVRTYHREQGERLPSARLHAAIHVVIETQLAEGYAPTARALARLRRRGLDRHEAIHAIGSVAAQELHALLSGSAKAFDAAAFERALDALDGEAWRAGG
jgi:hypothetical protein